MENIENIEEEESVELKDIELETETAEKEVAETLLTASDDAKWTTNHEKRTLGIAGNAKKYIPLYNVFCITLQFILVIVIGLSLIVVSLSVHSKMKNLGSCEVLTDGVPIEDESLMNSLYELTSGIASSLGIFQSPPVTPPTLIVQITVDQMRSDLLLKYRKRFIPDGGFDRLLKNGVLYRNTHYRHSRTVTPVGHATLITGGVPYSHGLVGHNFLDPGLGRVVASIENRNYTEVEGAEEIINTAPTYLESTTFGDELLLFSSKSKSFSVSLKDVPAVICGGHLGKSFWFSTESGNVISSTYFYDEYPKYVKEWNEKKVADTYLTKSWELEFPEEIYHYQDRKYPNPVLGKEFPKPYYQEDRGDFLNGLYYSPAGDEIMWDFMKTLIVQENLGKRTDSSRENGPIIDYISLSFSSLDKVSHTCGTDSIESEDVLYKEDRMMKNVLDFLDEYIGLSNCLIAFSSDHGGDLSWERIVDIGFDYHRIFADENIDALDRHINETVFQGRLNESVILDWVSFQIYLRRELIRSYGRSVREVQKSVSEYLMEQKKEVLFAFTKYDLMRGWVPETELGRSVMNSFHPQRSGDIIIIVKEYGRVETEERVSYVERHGTPWNYDQSVPMLVMGKDVPRGVVVDRRVSPEDLAPTLSAYFGFNPPSGCTGDNLLEVFRNHDVSPFVN